MSNSIEIDLTGIKCPMPIVHLNRQMKVLEDGDDVTATATDPAFCVDVEAWCRRTGHDLVELSDTNGKLVAKIRKRER